MYICVYSCVEYISIEYVCHRIGNTQLSVDVRENKAASADLCTFSYVH